MTCSTAILLLSQLYSGGTSYHRSHNIALLLLSQLYSGGTSYHRSHNIALLVADQILSYRKIITLNTGSELSMSITKHDIKDIVTPIEKVHKMQPILI